MAPLPVAPKHPRLLRPLVLGGLAAALAGSGLGIFDLLRLHLALGRVAVPWVQLHGQIQIFGFLLPFIAGCSSYTFPRIAAGRPLRRGRWLLLGCASLWTGTLLQLGGLTASGGLQRGLEVAAGAAIALGACAAAWALDGPFAELRRSPGQRDRGFELILELALAFMAAAGLADGIALALGGDGVLPPALLSAAERLALEGFGVGTVLGVSVRMLPGFLGIDPRRARPSTRLAAAWALAVALGAAAPLAGPWVELAADLLLAAAVTRLAFSLGLASRRGGPAVDRSRDPVFPWGARPAFALLVAAVALRAGSALAAQLGLPVHAFWWDAARHLLVIGFLMTFIATMSGRIVPGFAHRPLAAPGLRAFACFAFPAAAVCRAAEGVAGQWGPPRLLWLSGASGPLAGAAFLALAASLTLTLTRSPPSPAPLQGAVA